MIHYDELLKEAIRLSKQYMITTIDNPYDPFTQFDQWLMFDNDHDYGTCCYLARIAKTSDSLSDEEVNEEISRAIDEIIKYDPLDIYTKIVKDDNDQLTK